MISAVAAMSTNRVIGRDNGLPWNIPEDLKFFREVTRDGIVIMGRKTFDSIKKPLPNRLNIVITRDASYRAEGTVVFTTIECALNFAKEQLSLPVHSEKLAGSSASVNFSGTNQSTKPRVWKDEIFIIGGAEIYQLALPYTDRIYMTEIHAVVEGDTYFPEFDKSIFREISRDCRKGAPDFDFVIYQK